MMRAFLILLISIHLGASAQTRDWSQNRKSVDSLIERIKLESKCKLTGSSLKNSKRKFKKDTRLFVFLNDFYDGILDEASIIKTLKNSFGQNDWRFDQIKRFDSLTRYEGLIRSFGNLEGYIAYVVSH